MKYRKLGNQGISVSELALGTMTFGAETDEKTAEEIFGRCRDSGINFVDTADVYSGGRSEEIVGNLLAGCRDDIVLATKVFFPVGSDNRPGGLSRSYVSSALEASLRRLKTDYIDIYYAHYFDNETPLEEVLTIFDEFVQQGKIRHVAVSNWAAWQVMKAREITKSHHFAPVECIQPMYSLLKRQVEVEILPMAQSEGISVVAYGCLGGGLLSGKYLGNREHTKGRFNENAMYSKRYAKEDYYEIAARVSKYAEDRDMHPATLGVAWAGSHPGVTSVLLGARNVQQLEPQLRAIDVQLETLRQEISSLSIAPPSATDRS